MSVVKNTLARTCRHAPALTVAVAAVALAACGGAESPGDGGAPEPPPGPVAGLTLVPVSDEAEPGGTLTYRLRNESERRATYGACPALERLADGRFVPALGGPVACIEIAYVTAPGETGGELGVSVPPDAPPGTYRVSHEITLGGGDGGPVDTATVTAPATVTG